MQKQVAVVNFAQGLNTKTDPLQIPIGQFARLENSIFQVGGRLTKRDGYGSISGVTSSSHLTTLKGNLVSIGNSISVYSESFGQWISKGNTFPCSVSTLSLIKGAENYVAMDSVISNGMNCIAYVQKVGTNTGEVTNYLYAVIEDATGQNIVSPSPIPPFAGGTISGVSRVFVVGPLFVIVSEVDIAGVKFLQYFTININNPTIHSIPQKTYLGPFLPSVLQTVSWDGVVSDNSLVLAYQSVGPVVNVINLPLNILLANLSTGFIRTFAMPGAGADTFSCCEDAVSHVIYVSFVDSTLGFTYTLAVTLIAGTINVQFNPVSLGPFGGSGLNIASAAQNGSCTLLSEENASYTYDASIPTHFIMSTSISSTGVVGANVFLIRSLGLASKAFIYNGNIYFLGAYQSPYQPTYFLVNASQSSQLFPNITAKLAYQNGGGYYNLQLPSVTVQGSVASVSYLFKQNVIALNTEQNTQATSTGGIYSQLGINLARFDLGTNKISTAEIANVLHFSGGYLSMFDGAYPVEHNFFLFPDSIKASWNNVSARTTNATFANNSVTITVTSAVGIYPGMKIVDNTVPGNISSGAQVVYVNGTTITISKPTTGAAVGDSLTFSSNIAAQPDGSTNTNAYYYQVVYEWTDREGNIYYSAPSIAVGVTTVGTGTETITINGPYLRLTQKISNPLKITIYRWSVKSQAYYEVTSINRPILNRTDLDSWTFVDTLSDDQIVGNNLIYTTGGVVPNTNGPASDIISLFDGRLWLVSAEDPNLLWVSKKVVQASPVDMSSLFTIFVSPNQGTENETGKITSQFPMDDKTIIFKENAIFYINGSGPDDLGSTGAGSPLGNYSQPVFITSSVGCRNQDSIVLVPTGLMFQSSQGIWHLDRFNLQASYIGAAVEAYNSYQVTSANLIPNKNYVLFSLNTDQLLMYDYFYQQWGAFRGVQAKSSCIYNGNHTVLNAFGNLQKQTPGSYLDGTTPVKMAITTSWLALASLQGYQRFYGFSLLGQILSDHDLKISVAYDYNSSILHSALIQPANIPMQTPGPFGIPTPVGSGGSLEQWRIDSKVQLCQSVQISIDEVTNSAGAGFTLSGLSAVFGVKANVIPLRGSLSVGLR